MKLNRLVRAFLVLFTIVQLPAAFAGESVARRVEGILVPPPNGLVDVSDFSDEFRQLAKAGLEPGQIVIGSYFRPSEISLSEGQFRSPNARAFILLSYSTEELAKKGFRDEMKLADRDFPVMRFSSKEMKDLVEVGGKDVRAIPGYARIDVKGMTYIEKYFPQDQPGYVIGLVNVSLGDNKEYTMVYCCGWQRVRDKIIQLVYNVTLKDEKSIDLGRKGLQDWFESVEKANPDFPTSPENPTATGTDETFSKPLEIQIQHTNTSQPDTKRNPLDISKVIGADELKALKARAGQGDADAQLELGLRFRDGSGVPKNIVEAVEWLRKAAEQENTWAQTSLAAIYESGVGIEKNLPEAVKWERKAAEQGNPVAQIGFGLWFYQGTGVEQDYVQSAKWFRKAADQDWAMAQHRLGMMYLDGKGVVKDSSEAVKWFRKAAEKGNEASQYMLGFVFYKGDGVPKDYVQAYKWLSLAAAQGVEAATQGLQELEQQMTPEQIAEGQRLAREFMQSNAPKSAR